MSVASTTTTGSTRDVSNDHPSPGVRMVPAVVAGQRIVIECPVWCTVDHVAFAEPFVEDIGHHSAPADLFIPRGSGSEFLMSAQLAMHPADGQPAHVFVDEMEGHRLDADQADEFADSLAAFVERLRSITSTLRGVS